MTKKDERIDRSVSIVLGLEKRIRKLESEMSWVRPIQHEHNDRLRVLERRLGALESDAHLEARRRALGGESSGTPQVRPGVYAPRRFELPAGATVGLHLDPGYALRASVLGPGAPGVKSAFAYEQVRFPENSGDVLRAAEVAVNRLLGVLEVKP